MTCPMETPETAELLLDYCARKLNPESTAILERHFAICPSCRSFALTCQTPSQHLAVVVSGLPESKPGQRRGCNPTSPRLLLDAVSKTPGGTLWNRRAAKGGSATSLLFLSVLGLDRLLLGGGHLLS